MQPSTPITATRLPQVPSMRRVSRSRLGRMGDLYALATGSGSSTLAALSLVGAIERLGWAATVVNASAGTTSLAYALAAGTLITSIVRAAIRENVTVEVGCRLSRAMTEVALSNSRTSGATSGQREAAVFVGRLGGEQLLIHLL